MKWKSWSSRVRDKGRKVKKKRPGGGQNRKTFRSLNAKSSWEICWGGIIDRARKIVTLRE